MSKNNEIKIFACENAVSMYKTIGQDEIPEDNFNPWLEINTKNLAWNIDQVRERAGGTPLMAVLKCNAYGHGIIGIAKAMQQQGIDRFAVAKVYEAVAMRKNGIKGMILNFGGFSRCEAEQLIKYDISQSVFSDTIEYLSDAARKLNKKAKIHIKIDTGLGRVGVPFQEAMPFIEKAASLPGIQIEGVFTGLTEEDDYDPVQTERLLEIYESAKEKGISLGLRHAASSLAVANYPPPYLDMARPGNCFFGIETLPNLNLRPVMSLKTRVIYIKDMHPGDTIGYHRVYMIEKDTRVATIPLGYSDGYALSAVKKSQVLISGRRRPMIDCLSANHAFIDISGDNSINIGDEVVLFGKQNGSEITIGEVADWGGESAYHTAVYMNPMLPRIFM